MNKTHDGDYEKLRLVKSVDSANQLLKVGWILVDTYPQVRGDSDAGNQLENDCGLNYVLGWHRSKGTVPEAKMLPLPIEGFDL